VGVANSGPNAIADKLRDRLDDLNAELEVVRYRRDRKPINREIAKIGELLRWCETRAGYVPDAG
jgi:hypothetical protein